MRRTPRAALLNGPRTPLRVASAQNRVHNATSTSAGRRAQARRVPHVIGQDCSTLAAVLNNWRASLTTIANNTVALTLVSASLENPGGTLTAPLTFSGSRTKTLAAGDTNVASDEVAASAFGVAKFGRGETWWLKLIVTVPSNGDPVPASARVTTDDGAQAAWYDPAATTVSSTDTPGAYAVTAGTAFSSVTTGYEPALVGRTVVDGPSFLIAGTSIEEGLMDQTSGGVHGRGWAQHSMRSASSTGPLPSMNFGKASASYTYLTTTTQWLPYLAYAKYAHDGFTPNDFIVEGLTPTQVQARALTLWALFRAGGIRRISRGKVIPYTNSTKRFDSVNVAAGGTGFGASTTVDVTLSGGTLDTGGTAAVARMGTNSSGVVNAFVSMVDPGRYTTAGEPTLPNPPTGGTGSGLSVNSASNTGHGGWYDAANQTARYSATNDADMDAWFATKLADGTINELVPFDSVRADATTNYRKWLPSSPLGNVTADGLHPRNAGAELMAVDARAVWANGSFT